MKIFFETILLIIIVAILICLCFVFTKTALSPSTQQDLSSSVCIKPFGATQGEESCFSVELAKTEAEKERGLMFKTQLSKEGGMLFIFDKEDIHPFWMKNTLVSLDIIWIDGYSKVVYISRDVQPCLPAQAGSSLICPSVVPTAKAKYVLEVNAGACKKIGLKLGDEAKIKIK